MENISPQKRKCVPGEVIMEDSLVSWNREQCNGKILVTTPRDTIQYLMTGFPHICLLVLSIGLATSQFFLKDLTTTASYLTIAIYDSVNVKWKSVSASRGKYVYFAISHDDGKAYMERMRSSKLYNRVKDGYRHYHTEAHIGGIAITLAMWCKFLTPKGNDICIIGIGLRCKRNVPPSEEEPPTQPDSVAVPPPTKKQVPEGDLVVSVPCMMDGGALRIQEKRWFSSDNLNTLRYRLCYSTFKTLTVTRCTILQSKEEYWVLSDENIVDIFMKLHREYEIGQRLEVSLSEPVVQSNASSKSSSTTLPISSSSTSASRVGDKRTYESTNLYDFDDLNVDEILDLAIAEFNYGGSPSQMFPGL